MNRRGSTSPFFISVNGSLAIGFANQSFCQALGYTADELVGKTLDLIAKDDPNFGFGLLVMKYIQEARRISDGQFSASCEVTLLQKSGQEIDSEAFLETHASSLENGECFITFHISPENLLQLGPGNLQGETAFSPVDLTVDSWVNVIGDPSVVVNVEGKILSANRSANEKFKTANRSLCGSRLDSIVDGICPKNKSCAPGAHKVSVRNVMGIAEDNWVYISTLDFESGVPVFGVTFCDRGPYESSSLEDEKQTLVGKKETCVEERSTLQLIKPVLSTLSCPVLVLSTNLYVLFSNTLFEQALGFSSGEVLGQPLHSFATNISSDTIENATFESCTNIEFKHRDGPSQSATISSSWIPSETGSRMFIVFVTSLGPVKEQLGASPDAEKVVIHPELNDRRKDNKKKRNSFLNGLATLCSGGMHASDFSDPRHGVHLASAAADVKSVDLKSEENERVRVGGGGEQRRTTAHVEGEKEEGGGQRRRSTDRVEGRAGSVGTRRVSCLGVRAERRLLSILDSMLEPAVVTNSTMTIIYVNPAAMDTFGYGLDELLGSNVKMLMPEEMSEKHKDFVTAYMQSSRGGTIENPKPREVEAQHKDGSLIPLQLTLTQAQDTAGEQTLTALFHDLREVKARLRAEAEVKAELQVTQYLTHELRNPCWGIAAAAEFMLSTCTQWESCVDLEHPSSDSVGSMEGWQELTAQLKGDILTVTQCAQHMSQLLNNTLDIGKLNAGGLQPTLFLFNLARTCEAAVAMLHRSAHPGVHLLLEVEDDENSPLIVLSDERLLLQVLINILSNALKHTKTGEVTLFANRKGSNSVHLGVRDTGRGISDDEKLKLFNRYTQLDPQVAGTGLGLFLSQSIAELLDSKIKVTSPWADDGSPGSCFHMTLLFGKASESSTALFHRSNSRNLERSMSKKIELKSALRTRAICDSPLSFVVAEDSIINRALLVRQLTVLFPNRKRIDQAQNGELVLDIVTQAKSQGVYYDVLITDQNMEDGGGKMKGDDLVVEMRRRGFEGVIIGFSGDLLNGENERCHKMDLGYNEIWGKPMPSHEQIVKDIEWHLKQIHLGSVG